MVRKQSGQKRGRHFKGRGKEDWQAYAKGCPCFHKTLQGSINAMYSETSIDLSFDTIKQSREVNTVKLTVYICFLKLLVSLFAHLIYIQVVPFSPSSSRLFFFFFFN